MESAVVSCNTLSQERTLVFCTAFSNGGKSNSYTWKRYRLWIEAIQRSHLKFDQILLVDNGSTALPDWPDTSIVGESDGLISTARIVLYHFEKQLGRRTVTDSPGWVRSFFLPAAWAAANGFDRVIHIESDAFLVSERMQKYCNNISEGWIAVWCARYQTSDCAIQVIAGRALQSYLEQSGKGRQERSFPFTHIETNFFGDRLGDSAERVPQNADWAAQVYCKEGQQPNKFYWWLSNKTGPLISDQFTYFPDGTGPFASASSASIPPAECYLEASKDNWTQRAPLNRNRGFETWPHFSPGRWLDMNPSFVRLGTDAWVVFTRYIVPPEPGAGSLWVVRVDSRMQPLGIPIQIIGYGIDPRVIQIGDRVLVFYAIIERSGEGAINGSFVALTEFVVSGDQWIQGESFQLPKHPIERGLSEGAVHNWEKNWVPFAADCSPEGIAQAGNRVALIYSHDPWDVITLNVEPGMPKRFESLHSSPGIQWDNGTIRGGTPPVRYDNDHLITFFHSAQIMGSRNVYSAGACVFLASPPYTPVLMTPEPLLIAPYCSGAHRFGWRFALSVVFPLGADRTQEGYYLLCGRDDGEIATFLVRHDELALRLAEPCHGPTGTVHDYRGGKGARLPLRNLLYVPDPIPGIPELPIITFLRTIAGYGRTFVDVGSHIGFYSMGLASGFERVIAFEPSRFQYGWLRRSSALNAYSHVQCERVALGDRAGTATLNVLSYEGGLNSISPEVASKHTILDHYTVPVEMLDDRCLTDVDLLKIDVEGYEIPVLRGAVHTIAASRPVILIEVWMDADRRKNVQAVMSDMGYSLEFIFPLSPELALCLPLERRHEYRWFI